jgi:adenosylhomocysteine nucleosidase
VRLRSLGIVVALKAEAAALTTRTVHPDCIVLLSEDCGLYLSGMGQDAARQAALALADAGAQALATLGVAGALDDSLRSGMLLCPHSVLDEQGRLYSADPAWRDRLQRRLADAALPAMFDVALLSLPGPLSTVAAKMSAQQRYSAAAVDMESAAVAAVAASRDLPFIVLRAIIDERDHELPEALQAVIDPWGRPVVTRLLAALIRHPRLLARLPGLASRMNKAIAALRSAATAAPNLASRTSLSTSPPSAFTQIR